MVISLKPDFSTCRRILDVGCGSGQELSRNRIDGLDVHGIDIDPEAISRAQTQFPDFTFRQCKSESIDYPDEYFDAVISSVALPYTNIPISLNEINRVLRSDGKLWLTMHTPALLLKYFFHYFFRLRLKPTAKTAYALLNGVWFHFTGDTFHFPFFPDMYESFQTKRGLNIALRKAGFRDIVFDKTSTKLFAACKK